MKKYLMFMIFMLFVFFSQSAYGGDMKKGDFFKNYLPGTQRLMQGDQKGRAGQDIANRRWLLAGMDNPNPLPTPGITKGSYSIPGVDGDAVWNTLNIPQTPHLVIQFDSDFFSPPTYPGVFCDLNLRSKKFSTAAYPQDADYRTEGLYVGAIAEKNGRCAYGFGWSDFIFQLDLSKTVIVNQLAVKNNNSTLINACLDDRNNNLYVIMARDGEGDPGSGREIFRVKTRDAEGKPVLEVQAHVIIAEAIHQIAIDSKGNKLYGILDNNVIVYDASNLNVIGGFPAYGTIWPYPLPFVDKDGNIITIQRYASYDYKITKYSPSGGVLGQVTLIGYPIVCTYDGTKYAYVGLEKQYADPNEIHKIDVESMTEESYVSIPRVSGDSPHVLSVDEGSLFLVTQLSASVYEIKTKGMSYRKLLEWNPFSAQVNPSNKSCYRR